jgi:hypothetical protein
MKRIKAFHINDAGNNVEKLHSILNEQQKHFLEFHLWPNGDYQPAVSFSLAHNDRSVFLKFFVQEKEIRANVNKINGPVWEDSCVEFFVAFDESGYYNLEFNCLGMMYAAFGKNRNERTLLSKELLNRIESHTRLSKKDGYFYWEIVMVIPAEIFSYHSISSLNGIVCRGNFYKCGDGLCSPHYLSWANIESDVPDFHLPEFFGEIVFG